MVQRKIVQIVAVILHVLILISLFLPAMNEYGEIYSMARIIYEAISVGNKTYIITYAMFYLPIIVSGILIALIDGRNKYIVGIVSSTIGLSLSLYMFIIPAIGNDYLFATYEFGLYSMTILQAVTLLICCIGACFKDGNYSEDEITVDEKGFTSEIPIDEIISANSN